MPLDVKPNQDFLKFISEQNTKKNYNNLDMILNLENDYPGMFVKLLIDFNKAKKYRKSLDENGKPIKISWEEALKKFYKENRYFRVTKENKDIAKEFGKNNISQEAFDIASELRHKSIKEKIPEHILGKPLKEDSILSSIEKIRETTDNEIKNGKEVIEDLFRKQFSYEWLAKNDPRNYILGVFCSCCATIMSKFYGKDISTASVIAKDVQSLVVKDIKGEIIAKGTMYINKEMGYGVINEFEINEIYKKHESSSGRYIVPADSPEEKDRELIFKAFQRGVYAFVEEYDKQNPNNPIKQINVGMGYNRLKKQVEGLEYDTNSLKVPSKYRFEDSEVQYILYKRKERNREDGGFDR